MSDQMRITASSLLLSLEPPQLDCGRLKTRPNFLQCSIGSQISNVISSNTAASLLMTHHLAASHFTPVPILSRFPTTLPVQWSHYSNDVAQDSQLTSEACCLWSVNETRTIHVHPGIRVMENHIET